MGDPPVTDLCPGDMAAVCSPGKAAVVQLWTQREGTWRTEASALVGTVVTVIASVHELFEDALPGHLVLIGGDAPVTGWLRHEHLTAHVTGGRLSEALPPIDSYRPVVGSRSRWHELPVGAVVCARCEQWYSYGSGDIGPCNDSTFDEHDVGRRDPLHDWVKIEADASRA